MDKLIIKQSMSLRGEIKISGAKNAALPIICASLLSAEPLILNNVPQLRDIYTLEQLLSRMGVKTEFFQGKFSLDAAHITNTEAAYDLVKTMRASILVLGPLLARFGHAKVSLPGGCAIGARPIDQHIKGLEAMGAEIIIKHGYIKAVAKRLHGAHIVMDMVTVTGTENLLMAATLAQGTTILENAAREPEVIDLAYCLLKMGAQIEGIGSDCLIIHGVEKLVSATHTIVSDRIETGTFAIAAAITQGDLYLMGAKANHLSSVLDKLQAAGMGLEINDDYVRIKAQVRPNAVDITTMPYPAFPTDMQAQFMTLNAIANGTSKISETIFENRYMHVAELCRMGAIIETDNNVAIVHGVDKLYGAQVMATDLRASASLVLAGLFAEGETIIDRVYHLDRGYEYLEDKLNQVGANIIRIKEQKSFKSDGK